MKTVAIAVAAGVAGAALIAVNMRTDERPIDPEFCQRVLVVQALPDDKRIAERSLLVNTRAWERQVDPLVAEDEYQRCVKEG